MAPILVPAPLSPVVWAVGMHGLTDAWTHRVLLPMYVGAIPSWPYTSSLLTLASVVHFEEDVGLKRSLLLHAAIVSVASVHVPSSVAIVLGYMASVHVPRHISRVGKNTAGVKVMCAATVVATLYGPSLRWIPDVAQRVACIHIAMHKCRPMRS